MKISLIGGGNIGGTMAHLLTLKQLAKEVLIVDLDEGLAKGKALDIAQSASVDGSCVKVSGTKEISDISGSDVILVTAGIARKPGMSRDDLLNTNANIIKDIAKNIAKFAKDAFIIVVTNPLDAMSWVMKKFTGFDKSRVVGMAGILDTARMNLFLATELNVALSDVKSFVLGSHGDSMVPIIKYSTIGGIPLEEFIASGKISKEKIKAIVERTKSGGAEIVNLLKSGSAYYAPAASAVEMAESYIKDQKKTLPCSVCLNGHYRIKEDIFCGAPTIICKDGATKIIEISMTEKESKMFNHSVSEAKKLIDLVSV